MACMIATMLQMNTFVVSFVKYVCQVCRTLWKNSVGVVLEGAALHVCVVLSYTRLQQDMLRHGRSR